MLYERTALSHKPEELVRLELDQLSAEDLVTPDLIFKDPYVLDFLGLQDRYLEKDLEDAILRELEKFLLELVRVLPFWHVKSASKWITTIFTLICSFITDVCNGWLLLTSNWAILSRLIKVKWNSICVGSISTNGSLVKIRPWVLFFVAAKNKSRLNFWNLINREFMSLNT